MFVVLSISACASFIYVTVLGDSLLPIYRKKDKAEGTE